MLGTTRLDRYIFRTFLGSFVPVLLAFAIIFVIADGFTRLDRFMKSGGPLLSTIAGYYAAMLPAIYTQFGAFITLAAGMFAVARLQRNNELMPVLAGGISAHRALAPVLVAGLLLALVEAADTELLIPRVATEVRAASRFAKTRDISPGILRDRRGDTLYATFYRPSTGVLSWVTFRVHDEEGRERRVYWAERGRWVGGDPGAGVGAWRLERGIVRDLELLPPTASARPGDPPPPPRYAQRTFGAGEEGVTIDTSIIPVDIESLWESTSLLSFEELREQYRRQRYLPKLRVQLHDRIAGPLAHVILLLLGIPFVLRPEGGRAAGIFVGAIALIAISAGFFVATFLAQAIGRDGAVDPFVAVWTPTVAFGLLGIWMFGRVRT